MTIVSDIKKRCPLFVTAELENGSLNTALDLPLDKCKEMTASPSSKCVINSQEWPRLEVFCLHGR